MHNYLKLQKYADKVLASHKVKMADRFNIVRKVSLYLDSMIFELIALHCVIAILNDGSSVTEDTLAASKKYLGKNCNVKSTMTGGNRLGCATYMGIHEQMYAAGNAGSDVLSVDFKGGIARPQIGGSHKNEDMDKIIKKYINEILKYHMLTASPDIKNKLCSIIHYYVHCFLDTIVKRKSTLTIDVIDTLIKKQKVLHTPK